VRFSPFDLFTVGGVDVGWVTNEQLERARLFPALDYILQYESSEYKRVGKGYRLKSDNAFAVDEKGWYCHRRCTGSKTALDYLVDIKGYSLVEAVCFLLNESPQERSDNGKTITTKKLTPHTKPLLSPNLGNKSSTCESEPPKQQPLSLPIRNKDNNRVIAYLQSRGINRDLIMACIRRGVLFESKYYHNAVFLGKNEHGKTKFAAMRSTTTKFMRDADGSDKKYGFVLPPDYSKSDDITNPATTHAVAVFESPIESLSHQTMCLQGYIPPYDGWRISLSGISTLGLEYFLEHNPQVTHCIVCTNNDEAGDKAMARIKELEESLGITVTRSLPPQGNDWNNALEIVKKAERTQSQPHIATR